MVQATTHKETTHTIDATGKRLGRVATEAASYLLGKHDVGARRHIVSDVVVKITNVRQLDLPAKKQEQKTYVRWTGYPGGQRTVTQRKLIEQKGRTEVLRKAVYGMLPSNRLRAPRMKRLIIEE